MVRNRLFIVISTVVVLVIVAAGSYWAQRTLAHGDPVDPAGGRAPEDFPEVAADVFENMDNGLSSPKTSQGTEHVDSVDRRNEQFWI